VNKKKQKTSFYWGMRQRSAHNRLISRSFLVLFCKKELLERDRSTATTLLLFSEGDSRFRLLKA
jgi:hypothetical protein